jgi:hypothetical protein
VRTGRTILIAAFALLVTAAPALGAPGRLLDKSGDKDFPSVFVTGGEKRPTAFIVRVTATPNRPVEVRWDTSCSRRGKGKVRIGEFTISGKGKRKLKLGYKRPDDCLVNALVGYEDSEDGKIKVELFARGAGKESPTK